MYSFSIIVNNYINISSYTVNRVLILLRQLKGDILLALLQDLFCGAASLPICIIILFYMKQDMITINIFSFM
jgi:hypothetical protein